MRRIGRMAGAFLAILLCAAATPPGDGRERSTVASVPHFAFHSDLATNVHDALIAAGAARQKEEPEIFRPVPDDACFAGLTHSAQLGWDLAVDFYASIVSPPGWNGRPQYLLRMDLSGLEELDERARRFTGIARGFIAAATPAYEACAWPEQDAANRQWVEKLKSRLALHEEAIAARIEKLYGASWHGLPIRVDLVSRALPVGASTFSTPPHILVSTTVEERDALEILFHEGSHTLMRRDDPIPRALREAAEELDRELPSGLWHALLFYTTGQAVRGVLEAAGESGYVPYIDVHDLWAGRWGRYRAAIEKAWPAYLEGKRSLPEAALALLRSVPEDG